MMKMGGSSPCASCKLLRRRCAKDCIFAPYFPPDDPQRFAIVHKVFGASNVSKMLQELRVDQRADAVSSLVYEANARVRDPVYGCVGAISYLQSQVSQLQMQLAVAQAEILSIQMQQQQQQQQQEGVPMGLVVQNQQITQVDEHNYDEKSLVFPINSSNNYNLISNNLQQYLMNYNFGASPAGHVIQETPKRESLWT